jgi:hypothetical protein
MANSFLQCIGKASTFHTERKKRGLLYFSVSSSFSSQHDEKEESQGQKSKAQDQTDGAKTITNQPR